MIDTLRRTLQKGQHSFPAGGVLLALLVGYVVYKKTGGAPPPVAVVAAGAMTWNDIENVQHGGEDFGDYLATVLIFTSAQCPCADVYAAPVAQLAKEYAAQRIRFFAVFSNGNESTEEIRGYMNSRNLPFPAVKDVDGKLAAKMAAAVTPSVVIFDSAKRSFYQGPIGDVTKSVVEGAPVDCTQLVRSLAAVVSGNNAPLPGGRALGCAIVGSVTAGLQEIDTNDHRQVAGQLENGVLTLRLVAETGLWRPEKNDGAAFPMHALREEGKPLQGPSPLIRVPAGTEIRAIVRNAIVGEPLKIHGLCNRSAATQETLIIPSGEEREVSWRADEPGTFFYWANASNVETRGPRGRSALMAGALIVDPAGTIPDPNERIMMLTEYAEQAENLTGALVNLRRVLAINGLNWPYTERLQYELGERVRWRVINGSPLAHPMHLHGFHFDVLSRNDGTRETVYSEGEREKSVTELIPIGGSLRMEWTPEEVGRWLFHCHMALHFSPNRRVRAPGTGPAAEDEHARHALEDMSGLVMGIEVRPGANAKPKPEKRPAREMTLHVRSLRGGRPNAPLASYFIQDGFGGPPPDESAVPPPVVLTRGERTQIKVVNHLKQSTAVHWHGIELESFFDGVVGWGGHSTSVTPHIEAGGSFIAEMTPPRAGTFIYHTHFDDDRQLRAGLYGPLIVLEPGERYEAEKDRVVLLSSNPGGVGVRLNGSLTPSMQLKAGETYRLRLINITANNSTPTFRLGSADDVAVWRAIAKDGATLPPARATLQRAEQVVTVGETRDFEFKPERNGELTLSIVNTTGVATAAMQVFVQ